MKTEKASRRSIFEREQELLRLSRALDALSAGEGSVAVVAGPAGIGKTRLLEAAIDDARALGIRPLVAHASELERGYAFGLARQLVEAAVVGATEERRGELLTGAAGRAAAVLELDPSASLDRDLHSTLHGLYWLLVNLSSEGPILVVIDDLQWADEPSLRWLAYLSRRLDHLPIAVLTGARTDSSGARVELPDDATRATGEAVGQILESERTLNLRPKPLGSESVAAVLELELGAPSEQLFTEACRMQTGGNPFLISELVAELSAEELAPTAGNVARLNGIVPERVGETIRRHLGRVGPAARILATSVAVLGDDTELPVAAELARMELVEATAAAAELVAAQILADSPALRFRHPLLRAAVEMEVVALELAALHGRAARVLAQSGAPDGLVATHLMASSPGGGDPWVVERLRSAARSARSQGAPEQAAVLLRRALAEPPEQGSRLGVLSELGMVELGSSEPARAERFIEALELSEDIGQRVRFAELAGVALYYEGRHREAVDVLIDASERARGDVELREQWLTIESLLAIAGRYDLGTKERVRGRLAGIASGLEGLTRAERLVLTTYESQVPGPTAADLARTNEAQLRAFEEFSSPDPYQRIGPIAMYIHAGRIDLAEAEVEGLVVAARETGSPLRNVVALLGRGAVALDRGDLRDAEADMEVAMKAGVKVEGAIAFLVWTLALRGGFDRAEELLDEHDLNGELERRMFNNPLLFGRGTLRFAQRRWAEASADFRELGVRYDEWGIGRPSPPWRSSLALSLLALGEGESARELAVEELEVARTWDTPKSIATARRALALTDGGEAAIDGLAESLDLLEGTPWRFDRARVRCDLGSALRRDGQRRAGREALAIAMDEAHACGADPLAELAAEELQASGARPRRRAISGLDALTPSELRVAAMAAEERTNREIAQELFVTMATVETHLTRAYRKLDIAGRSELAEALAGGTSTG